MTQYWTGRLETTGAGVAWTTHTLRFEPCRVSATLALAGRPGDEAGTTAPAPRDVRCWIETEQTPRHPLGQPLGIAVPSSRHVHAWARTSWVTFAVQSHGDGSRAGSTVVLGDPRGDLHGTRARPVAELVLAVHDEVGTVLGLHRETQFEGGAAIDPHEVEQRVLSAMAAPAAAVLVSPVGDGSVLPGGSLPAGAWLPRVRPAA